MSISLRRACVSLACAAALIAGCYAPPSARPATAFDPTEPHAGHMTGNGYVGAPAVRTDGMPVYSTPAWPSSPPGPSVRPQPPFPVTGGGPSSERDPAWDHNRRTLEELSAHQRASGITPAAPAETQGEPLEP